MRHATIAALSLLALSACSSNTVRDTLGLERSAPDEFRVVSRPPLSVPPQFTLRPPSNSDVSPNQLPADKKAQSLLNGGKADANGSLPADTAVVPVTTTSGRGKKMTAPAASAKTNGADAQFLKNAGADHADHAVRDALVDEKFAVQEKKEESPWWDIFSSDDKKDPMVDAKKESERIRKNEDEGKPVTNGDTPEVKGKDNGILNSILGN